VASHYRYVAFKFDIKAQVGAGGLVRHKVLSIQDSAKLRGVSSREFLIWQVEDENAGGRNWSPVSMLPLQ
jgi:hypothetical protein